MSNSSTDFVIPVDCDPSFNSLHEISIYLGTVLYMGFGLYLHISILFVVLRNEYKNSSFFKIFVLDSFFSILTILTDLLFMRLFIYTPPLCEFFGAYFSTHYFVLKFVYIIVNYGRFGKSLAQILMVLNRMSCVLMPVSYGKTWKTLVPICYTLALILPFGGLWNLIISRHYLENTRGGFTINYEKAVKWAALSLFQTIYILTALFFTIICTSITLYKLIFLPNRIKSAEKSLCFTSVIVSGIFVFLAASQFSFLLCSSCSSNEYDILILIQSLVFDSFTIGTAVILILTNSQIRKSIFSVENGKNDERIFTLSVHL